MKITEDSEILQVLGLPSLKPRVGYDLPEVSVWALSSAIEIAYQKGYAKGVEDHLRNNQ